MEAAARSGERAERVRGYSLLAAAAMQQCTGMLTPLVKAGAKVDEPAYVSEPPSERVESGQWPLQMALYDDATSVVAELLRLGADPNRGPTGERPLDTAMCMTSIRTIDLLLDAGADVQRLSPDGSPPAVTVCEKVGTATAEHAIRREAQARPLRPDTLRRLVETSHPDGMSIEQVVARARLLKELGLDAEAPVSLTRPLPSGVRSSGARSAVETARALRWDPAWVDLLRSPPS